ncbi:putative T7SS-secreted protein [Streptomyces vinaceus]|uniref:putative T7SS-secreted protein n=1 Tax=Streptomyces vinaceus TaxID=1960 RepID=UPI003817A2DD
MSRRLRPRSVRSRRREAERTREPSRSAAHQLGADVSELELGQTDDPKKLVYGSVSKIRAQVFHLDDFKAAFESVGNGLKTMTQPEGLKGTTADTRVTAVSAHVWGHPVRALCSVWRDGF